MMPIKDAAKTDPEIAAIVERIQSGELSLESPGEYIPWTPDEKRQFERLLTNALDESRMK